MMYIIYIIVAWLIVAWFYDKKRWDDEGISYHPFSDTSFANPTRILKGNFWTNNSRLKETWRASKRNSLKFDNFTFSESFKRYISLLKFPFFKAAELFIPPASFIESFLIFAPQKGGKTTTLLSWLDSDFYDRAIVNEGKAGDISSKIFNKRKDIIFNSYDKRSHIWNILAEPVPIVEFYLINSLNAVTKDASFFTNDAKDRYRQIAQLTMDIQDPKEKWNFFIDELEDMFKDIAAGDQRSAKDVASTMNLIIRPLRLSWYLINEGKPSFTIKDFFERKNQAKLFMMMVDTYKVSLTPLFTAFTACVSMHHSSMDEYETTKSITFYVLDEFLDIELTIDARKILHTKIRSKGGAVVSAMHKLPTDEQEATLLTSSGFGYMIFSVRDDKTREFLDKKVGKTEYMVDKTLNGQHQQYSKERNILDWSEIDKLSANNQHVTYIPETGSLYAGKSDFKLYPKKQEPFIYDTRVDDFYRWENEQFLNKKNKTNAHNNAVGKFAAQSQK